jgi:FPC/CPF motif-containing protein YcgG
MVIRMLAGGVAEEGMAAWSTRAAETAQAFEAFVGAMDFPCLGAKASLARRRLQHLCAHDIASACGDEHITASLQAFAARHDERSLFVSLVVLFPGSARLVELADSTEVLQVEALCWCGKRATHNARTENGEMVTEGEVIVVGDVEERGAAQPPEVAYEVLCRQHHRRGMTAARAKAVSMVSEPLPFS